MQDQYYFNNPNVVKLDVQQVTIDTLADLKDVDINAIKIDVENYEFNALSGARELLLKRRPMIFSEIWYGSENQKKVFDLMPELKYSILIYDGKNLTLFDPSKHSKLHYFFVPNDEVNELVKKYEKIPTVYLQLSCICKAEYVFSSKKKTVKTIFFCFALLTVRRGGSDTCL